MNKQNQKPQPLTQEELVQQMIDNGTPSHVATLCNGNLAMMEKIQALLDKEKPARNAA